MMDILRLLGLKCSKEEHRHIDESFHHMIRTFVPERVASHTRAIIEYQIARCGRWHVVIADKKVVLHRGAASKPDLSLSTDLHTSMAITNGNTSGEEMYMKQKLRVRGDQFLLMQLEQIFDRERYI